MAHGLQQLLELELAEGHGLLLRLHRAGLQDLSPVRASAARKEGVSSSSSLAACATAAACMHTCAMPTHAFKAAADPPTHTSIPLLPRGRCARGLEGRGTQDGGRHGSHRCCCVSCCMGRFWPPWAGRSGAQACMRRPLAWDACLHATEQPACG